MDNEHVRLFSDDRKAAENGYRDGWLAEEDERGAIFEYTGQGLTGNQTLSGNNGTVANHIVRKKRLHVFTAIGKKKGSGAVLQRYIGEFTLDEVEPFTFRRAKDVKGDMREVVVFRLRPLGPHEQRAGDQIRPSPETSVDRFVASQTESSLAATEKHEKANGERAASPAGVSVRRESDLRTAYEAFLIAQNHKVFRHRIRIKGYSSTFWTDLYDSTDNILYEAKGSASRNSIREAIGQLFDYRRHIEERDAKLAVLLPEAPSSDLRDLLAAVGISLAYRDEGRFVCELS
ncbi:hypothetical protein KY5_3019c [Streptomyces formicae]|uniref:ScoMcrA-like SRA domain-containing protein n=1 Tax=Streptomyces formicae TaxID=1616117 RepID=A0A291Q969_9ACTN|nr:hypothetical protein KY5_3019c [Streptomyces formicae]